jgi:RNase P subunit RPR2
MEQGWTETREKFCDRCRKPLTYVREAKLSQRGRLTNVEVWICQWCHKVHFIPKDCLNR